MKVMRSILTIILLLIIYQTSLAQSNLKSPQNETENKTESATQKKESSQMLLLRNKHQPPKKVSNPAQTIKERHI